MVKNLRTRTRHLSFYVFLLVITMAVMAEYPQEYRQSLQSVPDTTEAAPDSSADTREAPTPSLRYDAFVVEGRQSLDSLRTDLGDEGLAKVLKLNRIDAKNVRTGDTLVVVDSSAALLHLSPFPQEIVSIRTIPKLILVSRRVQAFGAYEAGRLVRWGPTSTGKQSTPTPAKLYHTNWRSKGRHSSVNPAWYLPWYFNIDHRRGIAFHQYNLPGYPASHGCIRLMLDDARWLYDWATPWTRSARDNTLLTEGTPVLLFGDYGYGQRPPWKRLLDDPQAATVAGAELATALSAHLPTILAETGMLANAPVDGYRLLDCLENGFDAAQAQHCRFLVSTVL